MYFLIFFYTSINCGTAGQRLPFTPSIFREPARPPSRSDEIYIAHPAISYTFCSDLAPLSQGTNSVVFEFTICPTCSTHVLPKPKLGGLLSYVSSLSLGSCLYFDAYRQFKITLNNKKNIMLFIQPVS